MKRSIICCLAAGLLVLGYILSSCTTSAYPSVSHQQILEFDFEYGGYYSGYRIVHVSKTENSFIRLIDSDGMDTYNETIGINNDFLTDFSGDIRSLNISEWEDKYINTEIMDGIAWKLKIRFDDERLNINKYGGNAYPDNWKDFIQIIKYYFPEMGFK
jgi:hypothetical protein